MENFKSIIHSLRAFLDTTILHAGETRFTLWAILYVILLFSFLLFATAKFKNWLARYLGRKNQLNKGAAESMSTLVRYGLLLLGLIIILQTAGIDLSTLTVLVGTLGIGIGLGLQNVVGNMVSGLVILFERPIKLGDRVEVGNVRGDIISISLRSTTVLTNDNIAIIVPNSEFTSSMVINWSYTNRDVRFKIPVGVAYGSDPAEVKKILLEVAGENPGVLSKPAPEVMLDTFGDSALNFTLNVWTSDFTSKPAVLRSLLNFEIFRKFRERGVEIPFPQRDLHIKGEFPKP